MAGQSLKRMTKEKKDHKTTNKETETQTERRKIRWFGIRKFPILLRIIVVLVLLIIALLLGVMVGYGVLGDGNPMDALDKSTWQHIIDIVEKK